MTRSIFTALLLGTAVMAVTACGSTKGPGALGSKNDIVVRNNGLPGASIDAPLPPSSAGENGITSTVENAEAVPAPEVAAAETLADPALEAAAQQVDEANAPVPATTTTPMNDGTVSSTAPVTNTTPADIIAPETVTQEQTTPVQTPAPAPAAAPVSAAPPMGTPIETMAAPIVPDDAPQSAVNALGARKVSPSSVYPAEDYPAEALVDNTQATPSVAPPQAAASAPTQSAPVEGQYSYKPLPAGSTYNADPNAPYSPSASATAAPSSSSMVSRPVEVGSANSIKSAQAALKLKGYYTGAENGVMDAAFLNALSKYQGENGLPMGGLNTETLRSLGIIQ